MSKEYKHIICENTECRLNEMRPCINNINSDKNKKLTAKQRKARTTLKIDLSPKLYESRLPQCILYSPVDNKY